MTEPMEGRMNIRRVLPILATTLLLACSTQPAPPPTTAGGTAPVAAAAPPALPPSEQTAKAALESSPRHGEYADVTLPSGGTPIRTWVAYPERKDKAGVVLVIHEVFGLSDWIRSVAEALAREGFIAVAPDLVSGRGPKGGGTESAASRDGVGAPARGLTPQGGAGRVG